MSSLEGEAEFQSLAEPVSKPDRPVIAAISGDAIGQGLELALVTPPVGFHLFAFKSLVKEVIDTKELWQGAIPFVITDLIRLVIMVAFPIISVWLPQRMFR